jgi:hypothetical protein
MGSCTVSPATDLYFYQNNDMDKSEGRDYNEEKTKAIRFLARFIEYSSMDFTL